MAEKKIDYTALENARTSQLEMSLQQELENKQKQVGKIDSLKHTILGYIVQGDYETAKAEMLRYKDMQREYPAFVSRTARYFEHCFDVIQAIKTKRNFPGLQSLPMAKQQEILEKVLDHFEELKSYLHRIEVIEKDAKLEDIRSTVWVIKAITYSLFLVILILFIQTAFTALVSSFDHVLDDTTNKIVNQIFDIFE